jgi:hypothetical protein
LFQAVGGTWRSQRKPISGCDDYVARSFDYDELVKGILINQAEIGS